MYHGVTNERQGSELHIVEKEEGKKKQQLTVNRSLRAI